VREIAMHQWSLKHPRLPELLICASLAVIVLTVTVGRYIR
jgi:hypothetical protein